MTDSIQSTFGVDAAYGASEYGQIDDTYPNLATTKIAAEAIPFGRACVWDVSGGADAKTQCRLPSTTGEVTGGLFGISVKDQTRKHDAGGYAVDAPVRILRKGRIRVQVEETVVVGDAPFCRFAANGGNTTLGIFRNDADTASCVQMPGAIFVEGGTTATGAVLEIDLPAGTNLY